MEELGNAAPPPPDNFGHALRPRTPPQPWPPPRPRPREHFALAPSTQVASINAKAADSIADPVDYPNLFEGLEYALKAEEWLQGHKLHEAAATIYPEHALDNESDLVEHMKLMGEQPEAPSEEPTPAADAQDASAVDVTIAPEATAEAAVEKAVEAVAAVAVAEAAVGGRGAGIHCIQGAGVAS